jgi:hypothetical protein
MPLTTRTRRDAAPDHLPELGSTVALDGLPAGPCVTAVTAREGSRLLVDRPRLGGVDLAVPPGRRVRLAYRDRVGAVPCLAYAVVDPATAPAAGALWVEVHRVDRLQRRRSVRVPAQAPATVLLDRRPGDAPEPVDAVTHDLSAHGVLLRLGQPLTVGERAVVVLRITGMQPDVRSLSRVVRVLHEPDRGRPWAAGMEFLDISNRERDRLARYLARRQRELRRRATGLD